MENEKKPKVSVCVVTYNQEKYIAQCLQSLVDQVTDFPFEIIVSDDASADTTPQIVQKFADKYPSIVRPILHKKNIGAYENFKFVHAQARAEYVAHMDGDDYALQGKLQAQASVLDVDKTCTIVWHQMDFFDDQQYFCSGKTADLSMFKNGVVEFDQAIKLGFIGVNSSSMYRRNHQPPVAENFEYLDLYYTWSLLSKGHGHFIKSVFGRYRVASIGSISISHQRKIVGLSISHAKEFLNLYPEKKKSFFIWTTTRAIQGLWNISSSAFLYFIFALRTLSPTNPNEIIENIKNLRKIQVQWRSQKQQLQKNKILTHHEIS